MGIKSNYNKFLKSVCPDVFEEIHISEYSYKKIAIDISLYMCKFKAICGDRWLTSFINLISTLRKNEIHCIFIFDGKSPIEKEKEKQKRKSDREKLVHDIFLLEEALNVYHRTGEIQQILIDLHNTRNDIPKRLVSKQKDTDIDMEWVEDKIIKKNNQNFKIEQNDYDIVKELFDILNVPYHIAPWEAEKTCAKLCIDGAVDAVLSEDTDVMAYNTPVFLSKIDTNKETCIRIRNRDLLENLNLNPEQFLDHCIMCGTDYNMNIPKIGSTKAYKYICDYGSIENIAEKTSLDISILNHIRVRELFTDHSSHQETNVVYCGRPDFDKLIKFTERNNLKINIEKLQNSFIKTDSVIFEDSDSS
jgi:5'-3' exonuclease